MITANKAYVDGDGNEYHGANYLYYKLDYLTPYINNMVQAASDTATASMSNWVVNKIATAAGIATPDESLPYGERFLIMRNAVYNMGQQNAALLASNTALMAQVDMLTDIVAGEAPLQETIATQAATIEGHETTIAAQVTTINQLTTLSTTQQTKIADQAETIRVLNDNAYAANQIIANYNSAAVAAIEARGTAVIIDLSEKDPVAEEYRINGERTTQQPIDGRVTQVYSHQHGGANFVDQMSYNLTMNGKSVRTGTIDTLVWNDPTATAVNILNELGGVYRDAYETGWSDGWEEGYDQGYTDGYDEGFVEGYTLGWNDAIDAAQDAVPGS